MDDVAVRVATAADVDGFRAAFDEVAAEGRWIGSEAPVDWVGRATHTERLVGDDPDTVLFVAVNTGRVVGWCSAEHARHGRTSLGMGLVASHRGRGLGTRLLTAAVDWSRSVGAHKVELELWPHNVAALRLYERTGFVVEGHHRRHWRRRDGALWDSLSMGLVLDHDAPGGPPPT